MNTFNNSAVYFYIFSEINTFNNSAVYLIFFQK